MNSAHLPTLLISGAIFFFPSSRLRAGFVNGDFSRPLAGTWQTTGAIALAGDVAAMTDGSTQSLIWQEVSLFPGPYRLTFDFLPAVSTVVPGGTFPDTLFASVYSLPPGSTFDPLAPSGFTGVVDLFDVDRSGPLTLFGTITASPRGGLWLSYTGDFSVGPDSLVLVLDLENLNGLRDDSTVALDDFDISYVPEPGTFYLPMAAGLAVWLRRRRSTRNA